MWSQNFNASSTVFPSPHLRHIQCNMWSCLRTGFSKRNTKCVKRGSAWICKLQVIARSWQNVPPCACLVLCVVGKWFACFIPTSRYAHKLLTCAHLSNYKHRQAGLYFHVAGLWGEPTWEYKLFDSRFLYRDALMFWHIDTLTKLCFLGSQGVNLFRFFHPVMLTFSSLSSTVKALMVFVNIAVFINISYLYSVTCFF